MKRGKTALLLMEQLIMLLAFALAAALCLRAFVSADQLSRQLEARDRAADMAQNVAETLRHTGGDFPAAAQLLDAYTGEEDALELWFNDRWEQTDGILGYILTAARTDSGIPGLGAAQIRVQDQRNDQELFYLDITWQEAIDHGA